MTGEKNILDLAAIEKNEKGDLVDRAFPYLLCSVPIIVVVGLIAVFGKILYGGFEAGQESIAEAAKDDCVKESIVSFSSANRPILNTYLWDFERDCDLKKRYEKQIELVKIPKREKQ